MNIKVIATVLSVFFSSLTVATEPTPGECYDVGVSYALLKAKIACDPHTVSPLEFIPQTCVTAAISGCKDNIIDAMKEMSNAGVCAVDVNTWSYLQKEIFKNRECEDING